LTEAIIDAATLYCKYPRVTKEYEILSCYGTNGLIERTSSKPLKDLTQLKEITFFFDGDKPANEANKKIPGTQLSRAITLSRNKTDIR
jgi:DNA primase